MASNQYVNKVEVNGSTLVDLTADTVEPAALLSGYTAHGCDGAPIVGTLEDAIPITDAEIHAITGMT